MKRRIRRVFSGCMAGLLAASLLGGCSSSSSSTVKTADTAETAVESTEEVAAATENSGEATDYPNQAITAVSTFSTSSGTYSDAIKICGLAEPILGGSITVTDHAGGSGAVGTEYVYNSTADGYTLLCGTDSVSLFGVMELSDITYDDFVPIILAYSKVFFLAGNKDCEYDCLQDLIDAAAANPGRINVGTTGAGSVPSVWFSLLEQHFDVEFNVVQYEGNGDALTALMGGHIDVFITNTQQGLSYVESGDIKAITALFDQDIEQLAGVEKLSESFPDLAVYSGLGNFFQVSVHKDTPQDIIDKLTDAFMEAYETEEYQSYIEENGHTALGLTGDEAVAYEKNHQSIVSYIMYDTGATEINPADLGIERVTE